MSTRSVLSPAASVETALRRSAKRLLFPGLNLHARERYRFIPGKFGAEIAKGKTVLDAGCGNGMLAYQAWKRGARVLALSIKQKEIHGCRTMFNEDLGIPDTDLCFENVNLGTLTSGGRRFDAIICTEVLEHIRDDRGICIKFFDLLKPGGCLHITTPNADHPYNRNTPLDLHESGGHVRHGYTVGQYRALFEPIGFVLEEVAGVGGPVRQAFNVGIELMQERFGVAAGLIPFSLALPFLWLDFRSPRVPVCLYARLRKPEITSARV